MQDIIRLEGGTHQVRKHHGRGTGDTVTAKLRGPYEVFAKLCVIEEVPDSVRRALAEE